MDVTRFSERQQLIDWAEQLRSIAEKRSDQFTANAIQQEIDELKSGRFMLVVLGKVKRGKSTLCNAFLGRSDDLIAPIDKLPASSVISKFIVDEKEWVKVIYRDGRTDTIEYRHVRDFVTEQLNPGNKKDVDCVEVYGPFPGLEKDLVLVDTPGAGSIHQHHDAMLHGFLPQADAVIFLVTARMAIAEDELELLRELKAQDTKKVFFAINQVDTTDEEDIRDGVEHNSKMLSNAGIKVDRLYRISGKLAMGGDLAGSGLPDLLGDVSEFLAKNKLQVLRSNFLARTMSLARTMANAMSVEISSAGKSREQLEAELSALRTSRKTISDGQESAEQRFLQTWKAAIEDFDVGLDDAQHQATSKILKKIQETSVLGVKTLAKALPTTISRTVEDALAEGTARCERDLRVATENLGKDFPVVNLTSNREVVLRTGDHSTTLVKGAVSTGAIAGTGVVAIHAAGTVAASIAAANAAAVAAATSTVAAPSLIALIGNALGGSTLGSILGWVGTGTATVSAPVALATTPVWIALAGPVGWTLVGLSGFVIPFAYRAARLKAKDELQEVSEQEVRKLFGTVRKDRVPQLKKLGSRIVEEYRTKLQNDLKQIETAISNTMQRQTTTKDLPPLQTQAAELSALIDRSQALLR